MEASNQCKLQYPPAFGWDVCADTSGFYTQQGSTSVALKGFLFDANPCMKEDFHDDLAYKLVNIGRGNQVQIRDQNGQEIQPQEILNGINQFRTITKLLGYVPVLGCFVGYNRICAINDLPPHIAPNRVNHIVRGAFELLSLGFLLIIPDLLVSFGRHFCQ